eukprot:COSAG01_NODE_1173_length_11400_cov_2.767366_5_plen_85_part_00
MPRLFLSRNIEGVGNGARRVPSHRRKQHLPPALSLRGARGGEGRGKGLPDLLRRAALPLRPRRRERAPALLGWVLMVAGLVRLD